MAIIFRQFWTDLVVARQEEFSAMLSADPDSVAANCEKLGRLTLPKTYRPD
ncbi:MAG: hypothetical protein AAGJ28_07995 [Pseudomonadota bacterium]